MLKDVLEIVGIIVALIISILAAVKYWDAAKTAKEFSADIGKLYDRIREVETNVTKAMAACQTNHGEFNKEIGLHIKDRFIHRDPEMESFRYDTLAKANDTLAKAIVDMKTDLVQSVTKIENNLCGRIENLERTVRNGNGGSKQI